MDLDNALLAIACATSVPSVAPLFDTRNAHSTVNVTIGMTICTVSIGYFLNQGPTSWMIAGIALGLGAFACRLRQRWPLLLLATFCLLSYLHGLEANLA